MHIINHKFKRGQIFLNRWAGYKNLFIYMNTTGRFLNGYSFITVEGKTTIKKTQYYTHLVPDDEHFPMVGYINIREMWENALAKGLFDTKLIDSEYDAITGHKIYKNVNTDTEENKENDKTENNKEE